MQTCSKKNIVFVKKIQDSILTKVKQVYCEQKESGKVYPIYCDFSKLEIACNQY